MSAQGPMKLYLGDAVFATIEHGALVLTTEDGTRVTNRIVLRPEVLNALIRWERERDTTHDTKSP